MSTEITLPGDVPQPMVVGGMTLRDWFAGQALVGLIVTTELPAEKIADYCYSIADAMCERREE